VRACLWLDQGRLFEYRLPMPYDLKTAEKGKKFAVAKSPPPPPLPYAPAWGFAHAATQSLRDKMLQICVR